MRPKLKLKKANKLKDILLKALNAVSRIEWCTCKYEGFMPGLSGRDRRA